MSTTIPLIISIEGNIGSGKSTFMEHLKKSYAKQNNSRQNPKICFLQEPLDEWNSITDKKGETMLSKFYADSKTYAFSFQMMAYISRLALLGNALKQSYDVIITERCVQTDKMVFAQMLYDDGKMEDVEYAIYNKWFDEFIDDIPEVYTIYLKTSPEIAKQRIDKRARNGETIPLEYLTTCNAYHDNWLSKKQTTAIKTINVNLDTDTYFDAMSDWVSDANDFISGLLKSTVDAHSDVLCHSPNHGPTADNTCHKYTLMFDGGSRGNPGICGAGHVIMVNGKQIYSGSAIVSTKNTNNYAEYMSLINGMNDAYERGIKHLEVKGDSLLVIKQVQGQWAVRKATLQNLHTEVIDKITLFDTITFHHIPREQNKLADAEANKAMNNYEKITKDI